MSHLVHSASDLSQLYAERFKGATEYRKQMWSLLANFFTRWIRRDAVVLDLGCGYCEFLNQIECSEKYGMDLNPDSVQFANGAKIFEQDCSQPWPLAPESLDVVFTSNFFEHLPTKASLEKTLENALQSLKPGGRLIAMGPNIRFVPGAYWDFFDHYIGLSERSLSEVMTKVGFEMEQVSAKFMPYTAVGKRRYPNLVIEAYLSMPFFWKFFGKQFLVIGRRKTGSSGPAGRV